jgi:ketosteroid isomerase-like protein
MEKPLIKASTKIGDDPMKQFLVITFLAVALSVLVFGQASNKKSSSKAEQEVIKASGEIIEALGRTDIAMLDRIYADDYILTDAFGFTSKAQLMNLWKSGRVKYTSASFKDLSVRIYGDAAVTTGVLMLKGQNPRGDFIVNARATGVWAKQQGRWRLVAAQLTDIPQQQSQ